MPGSRRAGIEGLAEPLYADRCAHRQGLAGIIVIDTAAYYSHLHLAATEGIDRYRHTQTQFIFRVAGIDTDRVDQTGAKLRRLYIFWRELSSR